MPLALGRWLPALAWMLLIFLGSGDALSANHTSRFVEPLLRWLFTGISQTRVDDLHFLIRKGGHVTEYAVLALWFWWALRGLFAGSRNALVLAFCLATLYAASDEFHQSFVSSRGASVHDVVIDACGAAAALGILGACQGFRWKSPAVSGSSLVRRGPARGIPP